ncbi:MAG: LapA family protein [Oscillatoriales cyanobacterium SM2_1_8]|nr:LapA family protein [Oscillatoriales cyanobacterium SM2_1_8]
MKQIDFLLMFALVFALSFFALENPEPATVQLLPNLKVSAPIALEAIAAMGMGAILAWVFSVWTSLQNFWMVRRKDRQIQTLQQQVAELQADMEERKRLASATAIDVEVEAKNPA